MAVIDSSKKEINFKIVYYGPGQTGKTTSLKQLQKMVGSQKKTDVKKIAVEERTIFFDFLGLSSDSIGGYKTRFQVYTVPGQVLYDDARRVLLKGVDGIIFVADAQLEKIQDNLHSFEELRSHLSEMGYTMQDIPLVIQYNKVDLPGVPNLEELRKFINTYHVADFSSVATKGDGVVDAFKECVRQVMLNLKDVA
jgi:small GTP-binding protein